MDLAEAEPFQDLNQQVSTCTLCDLSKTRNRAVPGEGDHHAEVMFIGEGPGSNEDQQGRPFVGRAGQFLNQLIDLIELRRPDVYITNVVKCRPPDNRDPLPFELAACLPYLQRQIELIEPRVIVTLGRYSLGTFFPGDLISRVHGTVRVKDNRHFFPMYHPAAALHQERYKQTIIDDMKKLGQWLVATRAEQSKLADGGEQADAAEDDQTQLSLF
jgi:uracil-DNA glycosylase family 4